MRYGREVSFSSTVDCIEKTGTFILKPFRGKFHPWRSDDPSWFQHLSHAKLEELAAIPSRNPLGIPMKAMLEFLILVDSDDWNWSILLPALWFTTRPCVVITEDHGGWLNALNTDTNRTSTDLFRWDALCSALGSWKTALLQACLSFGAPKWASFYIFFLGPTMSYFSVQSKMWRTHPPDMGFVKKRTSKPFGNPLNQSLLDAGTSDSLLMESLLGMVSRHWPHAATGAEVVQ